MQVILELPDNIQNLSFEQQKEKIIKAFQSFQKLRADKKLPVNEQSKWAKIVQRVENDPEHLDGYSEQLKKDMSKLRANFEFEHDC